MLQIDWPWVLMLLPLPLAIYYGLPARPASREAALRVPDIADFKLPQKASQRRLDFRWIKWLGLVAWCLAVIAASRPQWLGDPLNLNISGRDLMIAVDLSDSMRTTDFELEGKTVDRLAATKAVAVDFIAHRKGDRLGLILFGSQAYLQTPLTFDLSTIEKLLLESAIGLAGERTAIGDAIGLALKRLTDSNQSNREEKNSRESNRVLILITDGANTAGEVTPIKAAQLASKRGLKIYTIGIGADEQLRATWLGLQKVNPSAQLDEKMLGSIAELTGGRYFRARDTEELVKIYQLLDQLEPANSDEQTFRPISALFYWPLAIALCLAMLISLFRIRVGMV